jgi:protein involved in polysaccharide export with SLBB domain
MRKQFTGCSALKMGLVKSLVVTLVAAVAMVGTAAAQPAPPSNAPPASVVGGASVSALASNLDGYAPNATYQLRVGDRITCQITWYAAQTQTLTRVSTIDDSGKLDVPDVGRVAAVGKTCEELATECKPGLERKSKIGTSVNFALETPDQFRRRAYIGGLVRHEGVIDLPASGDLKASQAVKDADVISGFADLRKVKLYHGTNTNAITLNMWDILFKQQADKDVVLQPGDWIRVPQKRPNF